MLSQHLSTALARLDRRLLDVVAQEERRAALLAGDGAAGWDGVRNLARPQTEALIAPTFAPGPLAPTAPDLGFGRIVTALGLDRIAADLLLMLVAPFVEPRYQSLYAMLQDDPHQPLATERLILSVLARGPELRERLCAWLRPGCVLLRAGFVTAPGARHAPLRQPFSLPPELAAVLMDAAEPTIPGAADQAWDSALPNTRATLRPAVRVFAGAGGLGDAALRELPEGARAFRARLEPGGKAEEAVSALAAAWRLGVACDAWPVLDLRALDTDAAVDCAARASRLVAEFGGRAWFLSARPLPVAVPHTDCRPSSWTARRADWESACAEAGLALGREALGRIAGRHRLGRGAIARALADYRAQAPRDAGPDEAALHLERIIRGSTLAAPRRAQRREPRVTLDDLVLRPATRAALERLVHYIDNRDRIDEAAQASRHFNLNKGPVALFHGRPGTGKTMAAEAVAAALGRPFFVVDLSQLVSKFVGETEKHIDETLAEAERAGAVLFFDEADAIFSRRVEKASSGGEQFSNMVVGYLLQRIEQHDGPIILASNLTQAIDEALMRRFRFRIEYPLPDPEERAAIWALMLGGVVAKDVDIPALGQAHKLSGGEIRNAALKAIFLADLRAVPVDMALIDEAVRLELYELGRLSRSGPAGEARGDDRGLTLRATGAGLRDLLEAKLRALFLKEIHVLEGPPSERNLSGYRPALSLAMFSLAGRRGGEALRIGFVVSAWSHRAEEEHEMLGVAHAFLSEPPEIVANGRTVRLRLQESHDFELLQRFWSSHDQPMKPSIVIDAEID